jgi:hypothetical protein
MSTLVSVPETLSALSDLVSAGDIPAARKLGKTLVNKADIRSLWLIARIANLLEHRPRAAADILRTWWETAPTEADKAIITACTPKQGDQRRQTQPTDRAPRSNRRNTYQAPSTVTTEQRPDARQRRRTRQEQQDAAAFGRYQADRAGVAEGDQLKDRDDAAKDAQVYASGIDYDTAALYGTRGLRCLSCWISRGSAELDTERVKAGHGDDGLCVECRESGRPGIPPLPAGHLHADEITARCAFICAELDAPAARVALRTEWKQATDPAVQALIADYVAAHLPADQANEADQADAAPLAACGTCGIERGPRDVRGLPTDDGQCAECRELAADLAADLADAA